MLPPHTGLIAPQPLPPGQGMLAICEHAQTVGAWQTEGTWQIVSP